MQGNRPVDGAAGKAPVAAAGCRSIIRPAPGAVRSTSTGTLLFGVEVQNREVVVRVDTDVGGNAEALFNDLSSAQLVGVA